MRNLRRAFPVVLFGAFALVAACVPEPGGGGTPPNLAPMADIAAAPTSGNVPLTVAFDGSGSADPEGQPLTYSWDLGNGATATGVTTSTTYTSGGAFTAKLTVKDPGGLTDTFSVTITVAGDGDGDGFFPPFDCDDTDPNTYPGAPDPAGDGIDQNCDGIDGTVNAAFVSNLGSDLSTCGPIATPCATVGQAITRAPAIGTTEVYVAGGDYPKFNVVVGIDVIGGYGQNWQRGPTATGSTTSTVNAAFDASIGGPVAVVANGINSDTRIADLTVKGGVAAAGQNSYALYVANSSAALVLDSLKVIGGTGGDGANGAAGSAGWAGNAAGGSAGGPGFEPGGTCNTTASGAGGTAAPGAGAGGKGGVIDTDCGQVFPPRLPNFDARPGNAGANAAGAGSGFGAGGAGGVAGTDGLPGICTIGAGPSLDGAPGTAGASGASGGPGAGGTPGSAGVNGSLGANGLGGGGGGGGGANDCNIDDAGAGGGGGGAGGARAASAGQGGAAGASSMAVRLVDSSPTMTGVQVTLGNGGKGGNGGAGASGQPGGSGGPGGAAFDRGGAGGNGANGGIGGASGAGGGGGGGAAIGVSKTAASSPVGMPSFSGGAGGTGGAGGNNGQAGLVLNTQTA